MATGDAVKKCFTGFFLKNILLWGKATTTGEKIYSRFVAG